MSYLLRSISSSCVNIFKSRPVIFSRGFTKTEPVKCKSYMDVKTNVAKDVILFKYENPRFFKVLNLFGASQFVFWGYLSIFAYTNLKDAPVPVEENADWWRKINLGENKYKNTIAALSFFIGYGILVITWMYTLRSVRYLVLRKGGKDISFVTYTPMGNNKILTVSLDQVSCKQMRAAAPVQLPLKIKNHYLHYILDMKGEFKNPTLFDHTAGLKRNWLK